MRRLFSVQAEANRWKNARPTTGSADSCDTGHAGMPRIRVFESPRFLHMRWVRVHLRSPAEMACFAGERERSQNRARSREKEKSDGARVGMKGPKTLSTDKFAALTGTVHGERNILTADDMANSKSHYRLDIHHEGNEGSCLRRSTHCIQASKHTYSYTQMQSCNHKRSYMRHTRPTHAPHTRNLQKQSQEVQPPRSRLHTEHAHQRINATHRRAQAPGSFNGDEANRFVV
jgi:hypothetical protein